MSPLGMSYLRTCFDMVGGNMHSQENGLGTMCLGSLSWWSLSGVVSEVRC